MVPPTFKIHQDSRIDLVSDRGATIWMHIYVLQNAHRQYEMIPETFFWHNDKWPAGSVDHRAHNVDKQAVDSIGPKISYGLMQFSICLICAVKQFVCTTTTGASTTQCSSNGLTLLLLTHHNNIEYSDVQSLWTWESAARRAYLTLDHAGSFVGNYGPCLRIATQICDSPSSAVPKRHFLVTLCHLPNNPCILWQYWRLQRIDTTNCSLQCRVKSAIPWVTNSVIINHWDTTDGRTY